MQQVVPDGQQRSGELVLGQGLQQVPLTQAGWAAGQTLPQAPQLLGSVLRFVSQPSISLAPLQSAKPLAQAPLQTPLAQVRVGMLLPLQAVPQAPQLFGSVWVSKQAPLQQVRPLGQSFVVLQPQVPLARQMCPLASLLQSLQLPPLMPHWLGVGMLVQIFPLQQPAQLLEVSQMQAPPEQRWPTAQSWQKLPPVAQA